MASARGAVAAPARPQRARRAPAPAAPAPRAPARRARRARLQSRGAIVWIALGALLLGGVVFINLADLRLNLRLEQATQTRAKLRAQEAALQSQLSIALASGRIQELARSQGLFQADPSTIGYINLGG